MKYSGKPLISGSSSASLCHQPGSEPRDIDHKALVNPFGNFFLFVLSLHGKANPLAIHRNYAGAKYYAHSQRSCG